MKAIVKTASNYRGLNGKTLDVVEIVGNRVTCRVEFAEFGQMNVDFSLSEVVELYTNQ